MISPTISDLYLAYRQAKTTIYFERRGIGLLELAAFEERLPHNLAALASQLAGTEWFDSIEVGDTCVIPKRVREPNQGSNDVIRIGAQSSRADGYPIDIQVRLAPRPEFAVLEVLYLWRFGAALDSLLSDSVLGYRLDLRDGELRPHRRWLFEHWPTKYQQFRTAPLDATRRLLQSDNASAFIISADLASFYDTIDPSFLIGDELVGKLIHAARSGQRAFDAIEYREATSSLLRAYDRYRAKTSSQVGMPLRVGVPIGALTSRVVANLALATLDAHVEGVSNVACYRRYVDDFVIVARASDETCQRSEILAEFLPLRPTSAGTLRLNADVLGRSGSEFHIQPTKLRIHHLKGMPGRNFIDAVTADLDRIVSVDRAFLDTSTLLHDATKHLVRANQEHGSPLRVLREADRARLERFALSTSLRSLERVSALVNPVQAQEVVRRNLESICRVLDADGDWVENLSTSFRLLKLAISTRDWQSCKDLCARMDLTWGSEQALRAATGALYFRDVAISTARLRPWIRLRNYLHELRLEAVSAVLPLDVTDSEIRSWLPEGLRVGTRSLGGLALRRRAQLLATSDLRSRDREDERFVEVGPANGSLDAFWMRQQLADDIVLSERLDTIESFVDLCSDLGDRPWLLPPARLFLCTRPPSYFDIARRWLCRTESDGFEADVFSHLLKVVNAIRGTNYRDPVGSVVNPQEVLITGERSGGPLPVRDTVPLSPDPRLILGNLVASEAYWEGAATRRTGSLFGSPCLELERLIGLERVLSRARYAARERRPAVLVLPELSIPRQWFRATSNHVVRFGGFGLVAGLEYLHDPACPFVSNQVYAVLPGPFSSVAVWPWTKRMPAREEERLLAELPSPVTFPPPPAERPRTVVQSPWGTFSVLICSEMLEAKRVADLLGRADVVLCPAWNRDTASFDNLVQSTGIQLHAIIGVANNGHYSDCRAWAPRRTRWERDLCRLIERDVNDVVYVDIPLSSLLASHANPSGQPHAADQKQTWQDLPPDWPQAT